MWGLNDGSGTDLGTGNRLFISDWWSQKAVLVSAHYNYPSVSWHPSQTRGPNWHFLPGNGHKVTRPHSSSARAQPLQRSRGQRSHVANVKCDDNKRLVFKHKYGRRVLFWAILAKCVHILELARTLDWEKMYVNLVNLRTIFQILLGLIFYVSAPGHLLVLSIWLTYWPGIQTVSVTIKYNLAVNISRKGILGHEYARNSTLYLFCLNWDPGV